MSRSGAWDEGFEARRERLLALLEEATPGDVGEALAAADGFLKDYPDQANGYQALMALAGIAPKPVGRSIASMMIRDEAPSGFRGWGEGFVRRLDLLGREMTLRFEALDGRIFDLSQMMGRVVMVYFWSTGCGPCRKAMPLIREARGAFESRGFEIAGISCDEERERLVEFLDAERIDWPQCFEGRRARHLNSMTRRFGINGIPHILLIDRRGRLRFDTPESRVGLLEKLDGLLSEPAPADPNPQSQSCDGIVR